MGVNVFAVAVYILNQLDFSVSAMKLQKLVYYSRAWSLVWDEAELFQEEIQAWANGPVVPVLYWEHQGQFTVDAAMFECKAEGELTDDQRETIDAVLEYYAEHSPQWLSDQTHREDPWVHARRDVAPLARSSEVITTASMAEYYSSLPEQ